MGRAGLISSGGESKGASDLADAVRTAVINDTTTDGELSRLHAAGVRGARFNFYKAVNFAPSVEAFSRSMRTRSPSSTLPRAPGTGVESSRSVIARSLLGSATSTRATRRVGCQSRLHHIE